MEKTNTFPEIIKCYLSCSKLEEESEREEGIRHRRDCQMKSLNTLSPASIT